MARNAVSKTNLDKARQYMSGQPYTGNVGRLGGNRSQAGAGNPGALFGAAEKTEKRNTPMTRTDNGAASYATTLSATLDFFSSVWRGRDSEAVRAWQLARAELGNSTEGENLARRLLFQLRDIRGGKRERDTFRAILKHEANTAPRFLLPYIHLIAEYGRWDDVFSLFGTKLERDAISLIRLQLNADLQAIENSDSASLLAKWLPTESAGKNSRKLARFLAPKLGLSLPSYRVVVGTIRSYLDVPESKMSRQEWNKINYERVSGSAMKLYRKAFGRHDATRFGAYLEKVKRGAAKINSGTLFPHDVLAQYGQNFVHGYVYGTREQDSIEALWAGLPDMPDGLSIPTVIDVSGSMHNGGLNYRLNVSPVTIALGMGLYLATRNRGVWHNKWIEFSADVRFNELSPGATLYQMVSGINRSNWGQNTDFQALFRTILSWYTSGKITAADIPGAILVISDMQFDAVGGRAWATNYKAVRDCFTRAGLTPPTLIFWQVTAKNDKPARKDDIGAVLLSGYSPDIVKRLMSNDISEMAKITPEAAMLKILQDDRYNPLDDDIPF